MADRNAADGGAGGVYAALSPGIRLERYVIDEVLAAGGFGVTYLATHETIHRRVVLKEHFPRQLATRETNSHTIRPTDPGMYRWALDRFIEEARMLVRCKHAHIVDALDVFEANNTAYMVLSYEEGQSFDAWLKALGRPPTQAELDAIVGPLLDALAFVHGNGLLHRDIAPDNIMIRRDGKPCLIDFGAARVAIGARSGMLTAIVKSGYSPLEQYQMEASDQGPWTDIYALSGTLYRAVTGERPVEATSRFPRDALKPAATAAQGTWRPEFLAAIDAGLQVDFRSRPQSVEAFATAMCLGASLVSPSVPDLGHQPHQVAPAKRRVISTNALAAAFVVLAIGGGWWAWEKSQRRQQGEPTHPGALAPSPPSNQVANPVPQENWVRQQQEDLVREAVEEERQRQAAEAKRKADEAARAAEAQRTAAARERAARHHTAAELWERIKTTNDLAVLERFITAHGDAPVVAEARGRRAALREDRAAAEWARIKGTLDVAALERFIAAHEGTAVMAQAMFSLAVTLEFGHGVAKNEAEAVRLYRTAAEAGHAAAMFNLGNMLREGRGVAKDEAEAVRWFRKAAEAGNADGMVNLGLMLENGRGVAKDEAAAVHWYRKAAEAGEAYGMANFGFMLAQGRGVAKDEAEAVRWFRKAAEAGNARAMYNLGAFLADGQGVAKDEAEAARWVYAALERGYDFSRQQMRTDSNAWSVEFRRALQRRLRDAGVYTGPIDGNFGQGTLDAIDRIFGRKKEEE